MKITLTDAGKRFNREWIFRHVNYQFTNGHSYAIIGPNGSGKSTLLQLIAGSINPSEGKIGYDLITTGGQISGITGNVSQDKPGQAIEGPGENPDLKNQEYRLAEDQIYPYLSIAAPYLEVIEEMTFLEFLDFHKNFKPFLPGLDTEKIIELVGLKKSSDKQIRYYSSGMKQRVKLAQAFFSNTLVLLLDEPCTNLDSDGIELYHRLIADYCNKRLVIVSSNEIQEYRFCKEQIDIREYK